MREFVREQTARLLARLKEQIQRASDNGDPDSIHDLRVAIRRFTQCLRIFKQFLPARETRKIRKRLKRIMDLAAEVRDRDVALELLAAAGPAGDPGMAAGLQRGREQAQLALLAEIRRVHRKGLEL
jgi:CHAD domain-containing protein